MTHAPFGRAASILLRSCDIMVAAVLLSERSVGLISFSRSRRSAGILLAYSLNPDSIQPGILWPTAAMMSCMMCTASASGFGAHRASGRRFLRHVGACGERSDFLPAPDFFQAVVAANRWLHDVDDHVTQVDQHPFAGVFAFGTDDLATLGLDFVAHR